MKRTVLVAGPSLSDLSERNVSWLGARTRMGGQSASRSPDEGAETAISLATLPDDGPTGGFFRDRKPIEW